jgi:hypothetical protein
MEVRDLPPARAPADGRGRGDDDVTSPSGDDRLPSARVCVIDEAGGTIREGRCASEPEAIARVVRHRGRRIEHIALGTGSPSQWLHTELTLEGFAG